jgi:hypothetical protein
MRTLDMTAGKGPELANAPARSGCYFMVCLVYLAISARASASKALPS